MSLIKCISGCRYDWQDAGFSLLGLAQLLAAVGLIRRYPFLLVDRVVEWEKEKYAVGYKCVSINDNFFTGHFPERPIMPGGSCREMASIHTHHTWAKHPCMTRLCAPAHIIHPLCTSLTVHGMPSLPTIT